MSKKDNIKPLNEGLVKGLTKPFTQSAPVSQGPKKPPPPPVKKP